MENVIRYLKKYPNLTVEIHGHTDNIGSNAENQILSEQRAEKIEKAIIAQGISDERIKAIGFGETRPIADNATKEGRGKNRRVEFLIIKQ